jgi:hypothetical protein
MTASPTAPRDGTGIQARGLTERYWSKVVIDGLPFTAEPGAGTEHEGPCCMKSITSHRTKLSTHSGINTGWAFPPAPSMIRPERIRDV